MVEELGAPVSHRPPPILASAHQLTEAALREAITSLHPTIAHMGEYHLGWRDAAGTPTGSTGAGRGVCLALPILSAKAVGAEATTAIPGAVALELVHVFTHMHDDIMDGDALRRHRDSLWKVFGVGPAILTGDALFAVAMHVISAVPGRGLAATRHVLDACLDLATGQALDLAFERRGVDGPSGIDVDDYIAMADGKTGALYGCALAIGAVLADAPAAAVSAFEAAGRQLGLVAQVADDINGTWGEPVVSGKPVHSDLMRRKKSLPVVAALAAEEPIRRRFVELWSHQTWTEQTLQTVLQVLDDAKARDFCESRADHHYREALAHLDDVAMPSSVRDELRDLASFIRHRRG